MRPINKDAPANNGSGPAGFSSFWPKKLIVEGMDGVELGEVMIYRRRELAVTHYQSRARAEKEQK